MGRRPDSVGIDELVTVFEEGLQACDMDIPDEDAETITTVQEFFSYIEANSIKKQ